MKKLLMLIAFLGIASGIFAQVSKNINLITAGSLSTSLTLEELSTITNLILTGTMDARDFVTLREDMPLLAVLDLSGVTIAAYTGKLGTSMFSNDYPADAIPDHAFYNSISRLTKLSLTTIVFPSSLSSIGISAFYGCSGLTTVMIPSSVATIGASAFMNCRGLTTVTIPSSVTSIGESAFRDCTRLTTVTIPSSVTTIGNGAFLNCIGLTTITISSSVTSIEERAFAGCSKLTLITVDANNPNYSSLDGVLFNKTQTTLIFCPNGKIGNFTIPSSVTSIEESAFRDCTRLTTVTIPSSVTSIGAGAFSGCMDLTSVTIPSSVTLVGAGAFARCSGLTTVTIPSSVTSIKQGAFDASNGLITVDSNNPNYSSLEGVLYDKSQTVLIYCPTSKIESFIIPSSVTSIGAGAFKDCKGLTTVTIPSSVTSIGTSAFNGCSGLTTVTIPSSVISIGAYAFTNCNGLTSLTTSSITPIDLSTAYGVFDSFKINSTLYVPLGSKSAYQAAFRWKDFANIVEKDFTGIDPIISDQKMTIYPNPTTGKVKLVFDHIPQGGETLTVNDLTGKTILTRSIQNKEEWIDLGSNSPGVYLIRTNMKDFKVQKVILK